MNKYLKHFLIFLGSTTLLAAIVLGGFWWAMESKQKQAKKDGVSQSKICDTVRVITEKPPIRLGKFHKTEIDQLKFYIVRNNKVVQDSTVQYNITSEDDYLRTQIPFPEFLKTDTIIIETKNNGKRYFRISGFHHYADLHYGGLGYAGSHSCRFAEDEYIVNGKKNNGYLLKENGLEENIVPR